MLVILELGVYITWEYITFAKYVPGNEDVRVAILGALGAWLSRVASSSPAECIKFFCLGLKEKDTLRRAHLRCLRVAFQNSDILTEVCARRHNMTSANCFLQQFMYLSVILIRYGVSQ